MKNTYDTKNSITAITEEWIKLTYRVLDLHRIPSSEIRDALKRTYQVLYCYHKEDAVPKAVCKMIIEMDEFLYFASMINENELDDDPCFYQAIHSIGEALRAGFFDGKYKSAYPVLRVLDENDCEQEIDLEHGCIEDLI